MPLNWGGGLDSDGEHLDLYLSRGIPETNARRVRDLNQTFVFLEE